MGHCFESRGTLVRRDDIRNLVIIAHVDHGKTTLVDCLLRQCGQFRESQLQGERILDTNDLERERGITILAKNIALPHKGVKINIIDTPGHADFGGEVERVVSMADGALLLVDAAEGPMPQTRFVLSKALACGLQPILVINKIDRPDARAHEVLDETFELIMELAGDEHLQDFPFVFTTAKEGYATSDPDVPTTSMELLLDMVLEKVPGPGSETRRAAADARHHDRLVAVCRAHRHWADCRRDDPQRSARGAVAQGRLDSAVADRVADGVSESGVVWKSTPPMRATSWRWWVWTMWRLAIRFAIWSGRCPCRV